MQSSSGVEAIRRSLCRVLQAGAQPVSRPPAPGSEPLPVMMQGYCKVPASSVAKRTLQRNLCVGGKVKPADLGSQKNSMDGALRSYKKAAPPGTGPLEQGRAGGGRSPAAHQRRLAKIGSKICKTEESGSRLKRFRGLSCFLAAHPLQVHAGRNQLKSLLVTVTDREALHARRLSSMRRAAPACRSSTARCAARPSDPGIRGQGFDPCRASPAAAESVSDASSSAPCIPCQLVPPNCR